MTAHDSPLPPCPILGCGAEMIVLGESPDVWVELACGVGHEFTVESTDQFCALCADVQRGREKKEGE